MAQHNSLNVKLSNSQLNKIKSTIKNKTGVVLRLSSNMIGIITHMMKLIFPVNCFKLIDKLQIFVELLLNTHQLILNCQKLSYLR